MAKEITSKRKNIPYKAIGYTVFAIIVLILTISQFSTLGELSKASILDMGGVTISGNSPFTLCDDIKKNCLQPFQLIQNEFNEIHMFEITTIGFSALMAGIEWKKSRQM